MAYLLNALAIILFAFHLMAMNVASAGPMASVWFDWRKTDRAVSHAAACYLGGVSIVTYLIGILLGIGLAAIAWDAEAARSIMSLLKHKIFYGVLELAFSLLLMLGYYAWLRSATPESPVWARVSRALIVLLAASNLLYHFPPLFAVAGKIADGWRPEAETITPAMFREQLMTPAVASQSVHFVLASIATAGIVILGFSLRLRRDSAVEEAAVVRVARVGGIMALIPTLSQILVGMWVLLSLPSESQKSLMGGDLPLTGLFVLSLAAALGLIHTLASIAMGDVERRNIGRAMMLFVVTVVLMTSVLYLS